MFLCEVNATIITYHYVNQVAYGLPVSKKDHLLLPCRGYSLGMLLSNSSRNLTGLSEPSTAMIFLHKKAPLLSEAFSVNVILQIQSLLFVLDYHFSET